MPLSGLNKYWVEAAAALPVGWEIRSVVKGPRQVDPRIDSDEWAAWARPSRPEAAYQAIGSAEGRGPTAEDALKALRNELRGLGQ